MRYFPPVPPPQLFFPATSLLQRSYIQLRLLAGLTCPCFRANRFFFAGCFFFPRLWRLRLASRLPLRVFFEYIPPFVRSLASFSRLSQSSPHFRVCLWKVLSVNSVHGAIAVRKEAMFRRFPLIPPPFPFYKTVSSVESFVFPPFPPENRPPFFFLEEFPFFFFFSASRTSPQSPRGERKPFVPTLVKIYEFSSPRFTQIRPFPCPYRQP